MKEKVLCVIAFLIITPTAYGNTVYFKDGGKFETPYTIEENGMIKCHRFGGVVSYPAHLIDHIEKDHIEKDHIEKKVNPMDKLDGNKWEKDIQSYLIKKTGSISNLSTQVYTYKSLKKYSTEKEYEKISAALNAYYPDMMKVFYSISGNSTEIEKLNRSYDRMLHPEKYQTKKTYSTASSYSASSSPASYDTEVYCEKISQTAGGSYQIKTTCLEQERKAELNISSMSIPYGINAYCKKIGDTAGGSYQIMETCIEQEKKAKRNISGMTVSSRIMNYCQQIYDTSGGSYQIMEACIEQELKAKK